MHLHSTGGTSPVCLTCLPHQCATCVPHLMCMWKGICRLFSASSWSGVFSWYLLICIPVHNRQVHCIVLTAPSSAASYKRIKQLNTWRHYRAQLRSMHLCFGSQLETQPNSAGHKCGQSELCGKAAAVRQSFTAATTQVLEKEGKMHEAHPGLCMQACIHIKTHAHTHAHTHTHPPPTPPTHTP